MMASTAHAEGSLVQSITYLVAPNQHPSSAAGHMFIDNAQPLINGYLHSSPNSIVIRDQVLTFCPTRPFLERTKAQMATYE
jgi:hypothetical protein